jgi:signal transduction histidine kinase
VGPEQSHTQPSAFDAADPLSVTADPIGHAPGLALARASQAIFGTRDVERLPEVIVREAMQVMAAGAVSLMLPSIDGTLYIAHACGIAPEIQKTVRIVVGEGIAGKVAQSREPTIVNGGRRGNEDSADRRHGRANSSIVYPVVSGTQLLGLLAFNRSEGVPAYTRDDLGIASVFAAQVMLALENVRFSRQSLSSEKLAAVGALAAGIAHEINTPMQFIGDNVQFATDAFADIFTLIARYRAICVAHGVPDDVLQVVDEEHDIDFLRERIPKSLASAVDGVSRVSEIVKAVKSFARPNTDEKVVCDINLSLRDALVVCRGEYKEIADVVMNLADLPEIYGHPGPLNQVFLNLIVNAAHAIGSDRRTTKERGQITIDTQRDGDSVVVVVRDNGCGIPDEIQGRIFEPFFTTKGVGKGTGLGLSIARTIVVERHAGSLSVESEVGRGTAFRVRLPLK